MNRIGIGLLDQPSDLPLDKYRNGKLWIQRERDGPEHIRRDYLDGVSQTLEVFDRRRKGPDKTTDVRFPDVSDEEQFQRSSPPEASYNPICNAAESTK